MSYVQRLQKRIVWVSDYCLTMSYVQWLQKRIVWVSDYCLMPSKQYVSYVMARTSYILMRWWWCLLCTKPTGLVRCCRSSWHVALLWRVIWFQSRRYFTFQPINEHNWLACHIVFPNETKIMDHPNTFDTLYIIERTLWRDVFNIAVQYRRMVDPEQAVFWLDLMDNSNSEGHRTEFSFIRYFTHWRMKLYYRSSRCMTRM